MWSTTTMHIGSSGAFVRSALSTATFAAKSTSTSSASSSASSSLKDLRLVVQQQTPRLLVSSGWKNIRCLSTLSGTTLSTTITQHHQQQQHRFFSSRSDGDNKKKRFDLQALPFSVSPEEALDSFRKWAEDDQGLRYLMNYQSVRIGAAYVPVWSFDINMRFRGGPEAKNWKPEMFQVYDEAGSGTQSVIYMPGLSAYAGYSYRRSLINPVHSTTLVFMGDKTEPFGGWMLRDMVLQQSGNRVSVVPDAWNATYGRAFSIVKEDLQEIVNNEWPLSDIAPPTVQTEVVSSRRVFMPTYVIDYKIMGLEYRAFVSGCDTNAPVGGVSHQIFGNNAFFSDPVFHQESRNFLSTVSDRASTLLRRFNLPMLIWIFRPIVTAFWFIFLRLWAAFPVVGAAGGLFAGFRKIVQPWMDSRRASADWERQREHESEMTEDSESARGMNDFEDLSGSARKYFNRHKTKILRSLSGEFEHEEGDFDWYTDWQAWAQQQWAQQAQSQQQQQAYQQQRQQQSYQQQYRQQQQSKPKDEFKWPFNPDDPYSVLGINRNVSDKEVSNAFRKEMLKYHPDTQPNASEAQKHRNTERSKLISEAYRKIKSERKGKKS